MSEVELLRRAAALMRERAERATAGPWETGGDGLVWTVKPIPGDPISGSTEIPDAKHIASWHPAVALAVADWLDSRAERADQSGIDGAVDEPEALAVARAYLGEA